MFEEGGCARLLRHLLKVRVDWDLIRRPLATEAHRVQKLASLPTERAWLFDLLDAGVLPGINRHGVGLIADRDALYASYAKACQAGHRRATQATLTKLLRAYGITDYRPDAEGARPRLYRFPLLATMRAQFEREFGSAIEWTPQAEWSCEPVMANLLVGEPGLKLVEARTA
jgi:hypothetical protein